MKRQKGVAMIVVMVALLVMLTTVISLFRNSGGALSIVGNMGFKQNASSVADIGVDKARTWLMRGDHSATPNLANADTANGYFETTAPTWDPMAYDWSATGNAFLVTADDGTGNSVSYVLHRLCSLTGLIDAPNQECVFAPPNNAGGSNTVNGVAGLGTTKLPLYRITVRVAGARNSLSYTQVIVY